MLVLEGLCMWLALLCATYYVWNIKVQRIERTTQLFVRRLYESAFIDQSMLLNTKMKVNRAMNQESHCGAMAAQLRALRVESSSSYCLHYRGILQ
ncbi:hypothetical protein AAFF_G00380410 [Aldrovandia affinis]|uniref:Uncharacterized protein n=1 Tax=Aldrovandia affinis TaxID=143900 RepID=A0AAD7T7S0_9TELE|nr:hypothetical protein AAFF_G00380410 [Aldrovandia affinis]